MPEQAKAKKPKLPKPKQPPNNPNKSESDSLFFYAKSPATSMTPKSWT